MIIKYIHHSCFLINVDGLKIVVDPYVNNEDGQKEIKDADFVLISHGHNDHTDGLKYISHATIITNFELSQYFGKKYNTIGMNFGGKVTIKHGGKTVTVSMVKALHTSSINIGDKIMYGGEPAGFIISDGLKTIYFMGDTDVFTDMKLICDYYKPDVTIVPIGGHYTMDTSKAIYAINNLLKTEAVIPMHFNYVEEKHYPIDITKKEFDDFVKKSKIKIKRLNKLQEVEI